MSSVSSVFSDFTEVPAGGVQTPSQSGFGSIYNGQSEHDVLSVSGSAPSTPPRQMPTHFQKSPTKIPGILNGNFAAITGETGDGLTVDKSFAYPSVANAEVSYIYASYSRVPVTLSFGFTQEPCEWHKVANFVADLPDLIRNTIEAMSH